MMNRAFEYLRISVTDECNLACLYCRPPGDSARPVNALSATEVVRFVRFAAACGVRKVRITGGEPLLHPEILAIVRGLAGIAGIQRLGLTTNGLRLAELAGELLQAGLHAVNISLPSLRENIFQCLTGGGELAKVRAGIAAVLREGYVPVKLNVVVFRGMNDREVVELALLARDELLEVRFIEYMPFCPLPPSVPDPFLPAGEILARLGEVGVLEPVLDDDPQAAARCFRVPGFRGTLGVIASRSRPFCSRCNRLRLTAVGKLRACLVDGGEIDVRPYLANGGEAPELRRILDQLAALKPAEHRHRFQGVMAHIGG